MKRLCPLTDEGRQWLYLIGAADGRLKVGKTRVPAKRLEQHAGSYNGADLGEFAWTHFGPCGDHELIVAMEGEMVRALGAIGQVKRGREIFHGITREQAMAVLRSPALMRRVLAKAEQQRAVKALMARLSLHPDFVESA